MGTVPAGTRIVAPPNQPAMLIKITTDGVIKRTRKTVTLKAEMNHVYLGKSAGKIPGTNQWGPRAKIITALGFDYLSTFSPLAWIPSKTIRDHEGKEVGNPDNKLKTHGIVRVHQFAVGRASDGTLRAHDLTLTYDLDAYFAADVLGKFHEKTSEDGKPPEWGRVLNAQGAEEYVRKHPSWGSVIIGPGICLVFDLTINVIAGLYREHGQQRRFADRTAVSICRRNIYKKHFGFSNCPESGVIELDCWEQPEIDFESLQDHIVTRNGRVIIDGEVVQVEVSEMTADTEDVEASVGDDDESQATDASGANTESTPTKPTISPIDEAKSQLREHMRTLGQPHVGAILAQARKDNDSLGQMLVASKISKMSDLSKSTDVKLLAAINDACTRNGVTHVPGATAEIANPNSQSSSQPGGSGTAASATG